METLEIFALILGFVGLVGGFLPVLPGPPVSWVALLLIYLTDTQIGIDSRMLIVWGVVVVVVTVLDYVLPAVFTRLTGGHKAAQHGATIGLVAGMFLTPIGMIAGSFIGAFIGELFTEGQDAFDALKAACGTFFAFILTTGAKVIVSAVILFRIFSAIF